MKDKRGVLTLLVAMALPGLTTACTDGDAPRASSVKIASSRSEGKAVTSPGQEAVTAYRAMWADAMVAARTSDPQHPQLDNHATDGALQLLRHMMRANREEGVVTKGQSKFAPVAMKADLAKVVVQDCADDSRWLQYTLDGALEDHVPGGHHRIDATVRKHGDRWIVESLYIDEVGTCVE